MVYGNKWMGIEINEWVYRVVAMYINRLLPLTPPKIKFYTIKNKK